MLRVWERFPKVPPERFWGLPREDQMVLLIYVKERVNEEAESAHAVLSAILGSRMQ